jgi:hypothetical protein
MTTKDTKVTKLGNSLSGPFVFFVSSVVTIRLFFLQPSFFNEMKRKGLFTVWNLNGYR